MKLKSPEGRGVGARVRDALSPALLMPCIATLETDKETGRVVRRDKLFGLLPVRDSTWQDGLRSGPEVWHSLRGDAWKRMSWQAGVPHGAWREWHGNGVKSFECVLDQGVLHGRFTRWRRDGTKVCVGEYKHGAKTGEWFYLHRDGKLDRERTGLYLDGERLSGIKGFNEWLGSP